MPEGFVALPLHEITKSLFGARTRFTENPIVAAVGAAAIRILQANPMRLGIVLFNLSGNPIYIAPNNLVATTRGIYLAANGGGVSLVWDRDFELCTSEWWAVAGGAASPIYTLEVLNG